MQGKEKMDHLERSLFRQPFSAMSKEDPGMLLEQYKLYVDIADKVSERRYQANSFFLAVNTALITGIAGFYGLAHRTLNERNWVILAAIAGIILCTAWRRLIHSYSQLNAGKFKIIHLLEQRLPAKLFKAEWDALNQGDGSLYTPFTKTELNVPVIFILLYAAVAILSLSGLI